ncbi:hypothetical protein C8Q76DRAFT_851927, partial [Earliella scabrosa]
MSELTTSRINRQFRTLRSKCSALTSLTLAPSRPAVSVTYGSSSRSLARKPLDGDDAPPLAILQSLDKLGTRLHLDRAIVENMQLSRRIYEVRDAFKNIVQSTFGTPTEGAMVASRVMPLAGTCARLVGEHIQSEIAASLDGDSNDENREDDIRSNVMDDLYEQVPSSHRKYTLVAHALNYILETCPHDPTLLNALLEVCVSHRLTPEARAVLAALFRVSILPRGNSSSACPLAHPAHKNFLTSLRETCVGSRTAQPGAGSGEQVHAINDRTFTRILLEALAQPCPEQMHAWTSKGVARLARELRQQDFSGCFVPLVAGLARDVVQGKGTKMKTGVKNDKRADDMQKLHADALERLAKWMVSMLDVLHTTTAANSTDELRACVDFLVDVESLGLHVVAAPPASPAACVVDAICCLAAYCIASPQTRQLPAIDFDLPVMERLLRSAQVKNQTFDGLVSHVFPLPIVTTFRMPLADTGDDTLTPPPTATPVVRDGTGAIVALATPLRIRGLLQCEVALYRGALEHVEALISAHPHAIPPSLLMTQTELAQARLQLLDRAEDAERRCYGSASDPSQPPVGGGEWVWEEMVGSWVVKSPAPVQAKRIKDQELERTSKRRKTESDSKSVARSSRLPSLHDAASRRRGFLNSGSRYSMPSVFPKQVSTSISTSRSTLRISSKDKENSSDEGDDHQEPGTDPLISGETDTTPAPKRVRNFATILADAHVNKISLRAEREAAATARTKPRASAPPRVFAVPESPASASAPPRRVSNFATLMADSLRNTVSLREERARERARAEALRTSQPAPSRQDVLKRKRQPFAFGRSSPGLDEDESPPFFDDPGFTEPESSPIRGGGLVEPSSDDALNLFAYPDSSPVA